VTLAGAVDTLLRADDVVSASGPTPFPLPVRGIEAVIAGAVTALRRSDWWLPGPRERVGAVLRGAPTDRLTDAFTGARPYRVVPPTASPANRALYAVGLALADRERAALVHLGVGSASDGSFHEALNLAALLRPNVVFLVAVHPLTGAAPLGPQLATSPARLAAAFGLGTSIVDGEDAQAVHAAVAAALAAGGPHLVEATLESRS
jgi:2-oxoisovalerate dehydrogenase E1 component alpha subunit